MPCQASLGSVQAGERPHPSLSERNRNECHGPLWGHTGAKKYEGCPRLPSRRPGVPTSGPHLRHLLASKAPVSWCTPGAPGTAGTIKLRPPKNAYIKARYVRVSCARHAHLYPTAEDSSRTLRLDNHGMHYTRVPRCIFARRPTRTWQGDWSHKHADGLVRPLWTCPPDGTARSGAPSGGARRRTGRCARSLPPPFKPLATR